jgi:signal transduction histidine kinase
MNRTIRDLLDFSRNEESICGTASLKDAVSHVERLMRAQSRWRQVEFEFSASSKPVEVAMASDKLVQLLLNLCLNSCVAMDGEGKLHLSWDQIDSNIEIYVDDSGPGVPEELRREIFEPFFTTSEAGEGTGLGLSVCESILHAVGGRIWVETSPMEGARFIVSLAGQGLEDTQ